MEDRHAPSTSLAQLLHSDARERNRALKQLYDDPVVRNKVRGWLQQYPTVGLEADDVIQESVILLFDAVLEGRFRAESRLRTFLLGICLNYIRNKGRKVKRITFQEELTPNMATDEEQADSGILREELTEEAAQRDQLLQRAFQQLTDKCRQSLRLYYYESFTMEAIATAIGLKNAKQSKKQVSRCREYLRKIIQKEPDLFTFFSTSRT